MGDAPQVLLVSVREPKSIVFLVALDVMDVPVGATGEGDGAAVVVVRVVIEGPGVSDVAAMVGAKVEEEGIGKNEAGEATGETLVGIFAGIEAVAGTVDDMQPAVAIRRTMAAATRGIFFTVTQFIPLGLDSQPVHRLAGIMNVNPRICKNCLNQSHPLPALQGYGGWYPGQ